MLRLLIRFIGLVLLAAGFIALIIDGTRSIAGGRLLVVSLNRGAAELFPALYQDLQASVESVSAFLWDPLLTTLMLTPVSLAFGGAGVMLIALSHRQPAPIGYARQERGYRAH